MLGVVKRAFSAGIAVLYVDAFVDQITGICKNFCRIVYFSRSRCDSEDFNIVFLCCTLEKSKVGLDHFRIDTMLLTEKLLVES
jgi:hypothetical protein